MSATSPAAHTQRNHEILHIASSPNPIAGCPDDDLLHEDQAASSVRSRSDSPAAVLGESEEGSSWLFTRLLYQWMSPLIDRCKAAAAAGRTITAEDLLTLPDDEGVDAVYEATFRPLWEAEQLEPADPEKGPSLARALRLSFGTHCYVALALKFAGHAGVVCMPLLLRVQLNWMIDYATSTDGTYAGRVWEGYAITALLGILALVTTYFQNASAFFAAKSFMKMRTSVMLSIFDKATTLPSGHTLSGRVAQMHGTDAGKFVEASGLVMNIFTAAPMLIGATVALYFFVGPAAFIGLLVAILTLPPQAHAVRSSGIERGLAARYGDRRMQKVNEFIQGIRIIKFMSWEDEFQRKVDAARQREVDHFSRMQLFRSIYMWVLTFAPTLIAFATFASAYAFGQRLSAGDVFPAFAMLNVLRTPLTIMPLAVAKVMELLVAMDRITDFLRAPDQKSAVTNVAEIDEHPAASVYIPKLTVLFDTKAAWGAMTTPTPRPVGAPASAMGTPFQAPLAAQAKPRRNTLMPLMDVEDLCFQKGSLTVVIGATASGKSVLVSAIVGETLTSTDSTVYRTGSLAYVAQEAWIMNETLKNNILMGKAYDEQKYKEALLACQLKSDLERLPSSDETEIGERGANLSGGQKQRIAFARAVYSNRDVVLMDDPLSAVDPSVCGALFHECIRGALGTRTRILVTHQLHFLPWADNIVVVDDLSIAFSGTYDDFVADQSLRLRLEAQQRRHSQCNISIDLQLPSVVLDDLEAEDLPAYRSMMTSAEVHDLERQLSHDVELARELERLAAEAESTRSRDFASEAAAWTVPAPRRAALQRDASLLAFEVSGPPPVAGADDVLGSRSSSLMTSEAVATGDMLMYVWYCGKCGWPTSISLAVIVTAWRVASSLADYMLTWWVTRARPFGKYDFSSDQYCYWYAAMVGVTGLLAAVRAGPFVAGSVSASRSIHGSMTRRLLRAPMSFFDTTPAGRVLNRAGKDMEMIDATIPESLNIFYTQLLTVVSSCVIQAVAAWYTPIVYVAVLAAFVYLFRGYVVANQNVKALDGTLRSPVLSLMNEMLGGLATLRSYDMITTYRKLHGERLHAMNKSAYAAQHLQRWLGVRTDALTALVIVAVGVAVQASLTGMSAADRADNVPALSLGLTYVVVAASAVGSLLTTLADLMAAFSSVARIKEFAEDLPQERSVEAGGVPSSLVAPPPQWPTAGAIDFEHVHLRYRPGLELVLRDVSFRVAAGEHVGVVGRTGSGKSTILLSLLRMIEVDPDAYVATDSNRILIDGVDIAQVDLRDLRRSVTIIPQDPLLFQGTVRSNLDPFHEQPDDAVWEALDKADMRDRVLREGSGLLCPVADRGANFSAGERQLLCLARALLKNCKVLLLDEATASIDPRSDQIVQDTIRREFADRTVVTIAHRLGTIIDSDKVLVLDRGRVAEYAAPHELLKDEHGAFRAMVHELGPVEEGRLRLAAMHHFEKNT